jgi:hypothetical protein
MTGCRVAGCRSPVPWITTRDPQPETRNPLHPYKESP